jgi:hypothetical protein
VAIEIEEHDGRRHTLPVETPPDPWLLMVRRTALGGLVAVILGWWVARTRRSLPA